MNRTVAVGVMWAVMLAAGTARADHTAYQNLPLEKGNVWVFITDHEGYLVGDTQTRTMAVDAEQYLGGGWYANRLAGLFAPGAPVWMYDHAAGSDMWVHDGNAWSTALRFGAETGQRWSFRANACAAYDVQAYDTAGITTPAGQFDDVRGFSLTFTPDPRVLCAGPVLRSLITAPGVGPIAFSTNERKGHLLYARVGGEVVAAAPNATRTLDGVETTLLVAEDRLEHPTFNCVTTPCDAPAAQLNVAFVVRNVSDKAITFSFDNGQAFEIDIWDGDQLVRRYSDDRAFTMALWQFSLAPGETRVLSGYLPFARTADGSPLSGTFQVVGYLKNTEGAGKLSLDVEATF